MTLQRYAKMVLLNAAIHSAGAPLPRAEALAVARGRIVYAGDNAGARELIDPKTEVIDMKGKMIVPGFRDAHIHPLAGSFGLLECRLTGPADGKAYLDQISVYARANSDQSFIRGGGWLPDAFPPDGPNRTDLDTVIADRPVILKAMDGHSAWVNTRALEMAGIGRDTPDPPGGLIVRDPVTGEATGTLREWSAMDLVEARLPQPSVGDLVTAGWAFQEMAARMGIVSVHEAMAGENELATYRELEQSGELASGFRQPCSASPRETPHGSRPLGKWSGLSGDGWSRPGQ